MGLAPIGKAEGSGVETRAASNFGEVLNTKPCRNLIFHTVSAKYGADRLQESIRLQGKYIEAGGRKIIPDIRDSAKPSGQCPWSKVELHFVVRIDQPELPVNYREALRPAQGFESLNCHPAPLDAQQFFYALGTLAEQTKVRLIQCLRQKMHKRKFGADSASAYLLMPAKRHPPCRKTIEYNALRSDKLFSLRKKQLFAFRFYVLNDVVDYDEIILTPGRRSQEIFTEEIPFQASGGEKLFGIFNFAVRQINPADMAAKSCERNQISALATSNF